MDIKEKIEELVEKITGNEALMAKFKKDPAEAVKELLGDALEGKLDEEIIDKIVDGVKAKISLDKLSGLAGGLGKLFK